MSVKAFIDEATEAALGIDAANRQVDLAKEGVEAARAALEASRAAVDTAKYGVTAAKEVFESFAERAEQYGLTRSKFKDVIERMKSVLADIGAIEVLATEQVEAVEQKPKAPRKRKGEAVAETASTEQSVHQPSQAAERTADAVSDETNTAEVSTGVAFTEALANLVATEEIIVAELTDPVSIAAAEQAAAVGHREFKDVVTAVEPASGDTRSETAAGPIEKAGEEWTASVDAAIEANSLRAGRDVVVGESTDLEVIAAVAEIAEIETELEDAAVYVEDLASDVDQDEVEDELDNSMAEQELLDFVEELTSDNDVKKVLSAAVKVVSWHTTNVAKAVLRTHSSPLSLAGVLVAGDSAYAPKDVRDAYTVALSFGGEKLAAAISWFNKSLDLMADAKPVGDFRFTEAAKPARVRKQEPVEVEAAPEPTGPAVEVQTAEPTSEVAPDTADALDEVIDATAESTEVTETIEDMQLFAAPEEEEASEAAVPEPAPAVEKPAPVAPKITKPSWLK
ncbi:hypothetical protein HFN89_03965 [Rhizobium laguerreae]|nr:hypothetical protein [Rhizobium laguerreae]